MSKARDAEIKKLDLILAYTYFRESNQYLNIIKALAPEHAVGILDILTPHLERAPEHTKNQWAKVKETNQLALETCQSLGAQLLLPDGRYACRLLIIPQQAPNFAWLENVQAEKTVALERFGSGPRGLRELRAHNIKELWVISRRVFDVIVAAHPEVPMPEDFKIVEVGVPYRKYPAFDFSGLEIDYIIAHPTLMFIKDPEKRCGLFANMRTLLRALPPGAKVALKPHNVRDQQEEPGRLALLSQLPAWLRSIALGLAERLYKLFPKGMRQGAAGRKLLRLREELLNAEIKARTLRLSEMTPYANLGLEHFLPFIKRGVITGISSCIWHTLYNRLPVYNCDNQPLTDEMANVEIYREFYVPPCHGKPEFAESNYHLIADRTRQADLIAMIRGFVK